MGHAPGLGIARKGFSMQGERIYDFRGQTIVWRKRCRVDLLAVAVAISIWHVFVS